MSILACCIAPPRVSDPVQDAGCTVSKNGEVLALLGEDEGMLFVRGPLVFDVPGSSTAVTRGTQIILAVSTA